MTGISWKYITEAEWDAAPPPGPIEFDGAEMLVGIYGVADHSTLRGVDGDIRVAPGEKVKLLPAPTREPWCYEVVDLLVYVSGDRIASLRAGSYVAVLEKNYLELLGNGHTDP